MKAWYGGSNLANDLGEPILDGTDQWMPFGGSVRLGATDSGHITGLLSTCRVSGTISQIAVYVPDNTWAAGGSWQLRFMTDYNGGTPVYEDTTIVVADGATGWFIDTTTEITVASGNEVEWFWERTGGGSGIMRVPTLSAAFEPSGTFAFTLNAAEKNDVIAAGTLFAPPYGDNDSGTDENASRAQVRVAGDITNADWRVFTNARTTDTTLRRRLNGSNIGSGITFGSGVTGYLADAGFGTPVAIAVGDYLSVGVEAGAGTEQLEYTCYPTTIQPTTAGEFQGGVSAGPNVAIISAGQTRYCAPMGDSTLLTTSGSNARIRVPFDMQIDRLRAYLRTNTLSGGTDEFRANVRVNGVAARTFTWSTATVRTGEQPVSNTDPLVLDQGDEVDVELVADAVSGSATFLNLQFRGLEIVAGAEPRPFVSATVYGD